MVGAAESKASPRRIDRFDHSLTTTAAITLRAPFNARVGPASFCRFKAVLPRGGIGRQQKETDRRTA